MLYRHAFRNSLLGIITALAISVPSVILGTVVVETIFGVNGMGRLVVDSLKANNRELFLSVSVLWLILQLGAYLLADVLYAVADPRVSYDERYAAANFPGAARAFRPWTPPPTRPSAAARTSRRPRRWARRRGAAR